MKIEQTQENNSEYWRNRGSQALAASHSRGTKPPYWRAKVALGKDKPEGIHNSKR